MRNFCDPTSQAYDPFACAQSPPAPAAPAPAPQGPAYPGRGGGGPEAKAAQSELFQNFAAGDPKVEEEAKKTAADRKKAYDELKGKFKVLKKGEEGTGAPNEVSEDELKKLASTYSDIRRDKTQLRINSGLSNEKADAAFKKKTMEDLSRIMQTKSGRALVQDLTTGENRTTIGATSDPTRAQTRPVPPLFATVPGQVGSEAAVRYAAGKESNQNPPGYNDPSVKVRSDVVLFHELTHANHINRGTEATGVSTNDTCRINGRNVPIPAREEQAVGPANPETIQISENSYRKERTQIKAGAVAGDKGMVQRPTYGGAVCQDGHVGHIH